MYNTAFLWQIQENLNREAEINEAVAKMSANVDEIRRGVATVRAALQTFADSNLSLSSVAMFEEKSRLREIAQNCCQTKSQLEDLMTTAGQHQWSLDVSELPEDLRTLETDIETQTEKRLISHGYVETYHRLYTEIYEWFNVAVKNHSKIKASECTAVSVEFEKNGSKLEEMKKTADIFREDLQPSDQRLLVEQIQSAEKKYRNLFANMTKRKDTLEAASKSYDKAAGDMEELSEWLRMTEEQVEKSSCTGFETEDLQREIRNNLVSNVVCFL